MRAKARGLMYADLKKSGLTEFEAKRLRIDALTSDEVSALTKEQIITSAYRIAYFDLDGAVDPLFFRLRRLDDDYGSGTGFRYWQPKDSIPRLYMPPVLPNKQSWAAVAADPTVTIYITEGEKKAAKGCLSGGVFAGLGGVWNFKSKRAGQILLRDLARINWKGRKVIFVYDAEVAGRASLLGALSTLASELAKLGARCVQIDLPSALDRKIGLDDYLLDNSLDDLTALEESPLDDVLWKLNTEYAVLRTPTGQILRLSDGELMTSHHFTQVEVCDRAITVIGAQSVKQLNGGAEWLKWPQRNVIAKVAYEPARAFPIYEIKRDDGEVESYFNRYRGLAVEPAAGASDADVAPFLWLLDHVFDDLPPNHRDWLISWFAFPLTKPDEHMRTAVVVHGDHWIGKDLIGVSIGKIYGPNYKLIGPKQLHDSFDGWLADRQFIHVEEIGSTDKRIDADFLKIRISAEMITLNPKYGRQVTINNYAHYYFTSNHVDPLQIDDSENRYFVHDSHARRLTEVEVARYLKWRDEQGGIAKLLRWLLDYPIKKPFNPNIAPQTEARRELADTGLTDLMRFAREILEDPYRRLGPRALGATPAKIEKIDLWDTDQIMNAYKRDHPDHKNLTEHALGNALRSTRKIWKIKKLVPNGRGQRRRVWVCANFDAWRKADLNQIAYEYQRHDNDKPKVYPTKK